MHLHGEDGGDSDSSADDSSDDEAAVNGMLAGRNHSEAESSGEADDRSDASEDDGSDHSGSEGGDASFEAFDSDADPSAFQKLEDISEDDFDEGGFDPELEALRRSWMDPAMPAAGLHHEERSEGGTDSAAALIPDPDNPLPQEGEETVALKQNKLPQRRALKCRLCDGKLLLNPLMLRQHIASKKHVKRCIGDVEDPICFADSIGPKENVETHQERSMRIAAERQQQEQAAAAAKDLAASKLKRKEARKRKQLHASAVPAVVVSGSGEGNTTALSTTNKQQQKENKKGKVGKRQRIALKQTAATGDSTQEGVKTYSNGTKAAVKQRQKKSRKLQPSGDNRAAKRAGKQAAFAASAASAPKVA